ncbi:hypothetical protein ACFXPI_01625 [Streptomyces sp. NPDC059104]
MKKENPVEQSKSAAASSATPAEAMEEIAEAVVVAQDVFDEE